MDEVHWGDSRTYSDADRTDADSRAAVTDSYADIVNANADRIAHANAAYYAYRHPVPHPIDYAEYYTRAISDPDTWRAAKSITDAYLAAEAHAHRSDM